MRWAWLLVPGWVLLGTMAGGAQAAVINVPGDAATIQGGIDLASDGDEVVVAPGTYPIDDATGSISFLGKGITVRSSDGPEVTIIYSTAIYEDVVAFDNREGRDSVLRGFTIRGGATFASGIAIETAGPTIEENVIENSQAYSMGAGVLASSSSALIRNNVIRNNSIFKTGAGPGPQPGAGMYLQGGTPEIVNNFFLHNSIGCGLGFCIQSEGAGIYVSGGSPRIVGNVFARNRLGQTAAEFGGAIALRGTTDAVVANNTFFDNYAEHNPGWTYEKDGGGALYIAATNAGLLVVNNIFLENETFGVLCGSASADVTFRTNSLFGNIEADYEDCPAGAGDLFADPELVGPAEGDYHLAETSPLADRGTAVAGLPDEDIYGDPRMADFNGNGTPEVDVGADELPAAPGWGVAAATGATMAGPSGVQGSMVLNALGLLVVPMLLGLVRGSRRTRVPRP